MMKKYNKPEIVALALDAVDVIETSAKVAKAELEAQGVANVVAIENNIESMANKWSW